VSVTISGVPVEQIRGVGLHRAQATLQGWVVYRLSGPIDQEAAGTIKLSEGTGKHWSG